MSEKVFLEWSFGTLDGDEYFIVWQSLVFESVVLYCQPPDCSSGGNLNDFTRGDGNQELFDDRNLIFEVPAISQEEVKRLEQEAYDEHQDEYCHECMRWLDNDYISDRNDCSKCDTSEPVADEIEKK